MRRLVISLVLLALIATVAQAQYVYDRNGHVYNASKTGTKYGGVYENGFAAMADSASIMYPDTTYTATATAGGTAYKVIVGSLNDPAVCWNLQQFRQLEKNTSWYVTGPKPVDLALSINNGQDSLLIWDRQKATTYMIFASGANNIIQDATPTLTGVKYLDEKVYVSGTGGAALTIIDFVKDRAYLYNTSGVYIYNGDLSQRNSGNGYILLNSSPAIVNASVNAVSVIRDPDGGIDEVGRPKHLWRVDTGSSGNSTGSIYIPSRDAIYDDDVAASTTGLFSNLLSNGHLFVIWSGSTRDGFTWKHYSQIISADGEGYNNTWMNVEVGSQNIPFDNATILSQSAVIPNASVSGNNSPLVVFGSDSGLVVSHAKRNDNTNGLTFAIDATRNAPAWSTTADSLGWSFESATDTLNVWSKKLTRAGTGAGVTYGAGVIGQAATLDGSVNGYFVRNNDHSFRLGTSNWAVSLWFKSSSASNPGTGQALWTLRSTPDFVRVILETDGSYLIDVSDDDATVDRINPAFDIYDGNWHQSVLQRNGSTFEAYTDGELVGSVAVSNANTAIDPDSLAIGSQVAGDPSTFVKFAGSVDQFQKIPRALSASEIRWLYQQGLRGIQNSVDPNDALHAADADYVYVDPSGKWIGFGNQDSITITDEFLIPKYRYGTPNGTLKSAALWSGAGMDSLSYALGTSTRLKLAQTDVRIAEMASGQSPGQGGHDPVWRLPFYAIAPEDSGTVTQGAWTITGADSSGKFKYADTSPGNLRVGLNLEVRGAVRYGSLAAVGADIAEMFTVADSNFTLTIKAINDPSKIEINVPPLVESTTGILFDNDSTRTYVFKVIRNEQFQQGRAFIHAGVTGQTGLIPVTVVYAKGAEAGDSLWYKSDSTTVKIAVTVVMGDTVALASPVPANTGFTIYPPSLLAKYVQSTLRGGDVVQMVGTKTMGRATQIGKKAWIVSSDPATVLNVDMKGVPVALIGTVPCRVSYHAVRGAVTFGDALTGGPNGDLVKALAGEPVSAWAQEVVSSGTKKISVIAVP